MIIRTRAQALAGFRIGILVLDTHHDLVLGNIQHAGTFDFPVLYEIVRGVSGADLMSGDDRAAENIVAGAVRLEKAGVDAIAGACGSFANYQDAVAMAVQVPVFMSILLEIPLLLRSLPPAYQLGVIFASISTFTSKVRTQCGIMEIDRIVAIGADTLAAFQPIITQQGPLDSAALGQSVAAVCKRTQEQHPRIGAWLLQCSDLPPYAALIQKATQRPVFDMLTLIRHIYHACCRGTFHGELCGDAA
jgi:hypothetical protein